MIYRKLKRVWSHNDMNYIPNFRETFPELKNVSNQEMCDRWISLGIDFYTKKQTKVKPLIRITLPFAIILIILMFLTLPLKFILTGSWGYSFNNKNIIFNWFKSLRLN